MSGDLNRSACIFYKNYEITGMSGHVEILLLLGFVLKEASRVQLADKNHHLAAVAAL